jgi:hypothetical protein
MTMEIPSGQEKNARAFSTPGVWQENMVKEWAFFARYESLQVSGARKPGPKPRANIVHSFSDSEKIIH